MTNFIKPFFIILLTILLSSKAFSADDSKREITDADLSEVIKAVLNHPEVTMYLHPKAPGRLPVVVALAKPYSYRVVNIEMFGEPVIITTDPKDLKTAVKLRLACSPNFCNVNVSYDPEGIHGTVSLALENTKWSVKDATIYE